MSEDVPEPRWPSAAAVLGLPRRVRVDLPRDWSQQRGTVPVRDEDLPPGRRSVVAEVGVTPTGVAGPVLELRAGSTGAPVAALAPVAASADREWRIEVAAHDDLVVRVAADAAEILDEGRTPVMTATCGPGADGRTRLWTVRRGLTQVATAERVVVGSGSIPPWRAIWVLHVEPAQDHVTSVATALLPLALDLAR